MIRAVLSAGAALVAAAAALPIAAAPSSVAVTASTLDLTSAAGREALDARVRRAARRVCANQGAPGLKARAAAQRCINDTVADAAAQVRALADRGGSVSGSTALR